MLRTSSKPFLAQVRRARCLHSSSSLLKAEFFRMPAMSPTMEKGGVTDWKFKEGESFNGGDVLLEVETDKAQIDVEAQDDGIVAKILLQNGATDIPVGTPIAIIAEPGDDLANLELPKEKVEQTSSETEKSAPEPVKEEEPKPSTQEPSKPAQDVSSKAEPNQVFLPSVSTLLAENKISREEALSKITATGPKGRIIKGDVLAYLGKISKDSVNRISSFIEAHSKLDLSNIERLKITPKQPAQSLKESEKSKPAETAKKEPKIITKVFNLESLLELQASTAQKGLKPFTINSYIEKASKKAEAFAYQAHPIKSDFYDPIFESLITPDAQIERFSIVLDIPAESKQIPGFAGQSDVFDLFDAQESFFESLSSEEFTVKLTINEKVVDAEEKAKLYLNKLESYIYHI